MEAPAKKPYFIFPPITAFKELSFEQLSADNVQSFIGMFRSDENPFTDLRFKDAQEAEKYVSYLEQYGAFSPKHGGQDWLFLWNGRYVGVLHLYDLSLETFAQNHKRCWIGFATAPGMRRKGITKKALLYFIDYIFANYPLIDYIHSMTLKENLASQSLLQTTGFKDDPAERLSDEHSFYLIERINHRLIFPAITNNS